MCDLRARIVLTSLVTIVLAACAPHIRYGSTLGTAPMTTFSGGPQIAAVGGDAGTVHVAWEDGDELSYSKTTMGRFLVNQSSPMPGIPIGGGAVESAVSLAAWGPRVYVAAESEGPLNDSVHFVSSDDYGDSFSATKVLSNPANGVSSVRVAGSGSYVSIVWIEELRIVGGPNSDIAYVSSSSDGGQTFTTPTNLSGEMPINSNVRVAVDQGNVNVAWCRPQSPGNADLFTRRSEDGGVNFASSLLIDDNVSICGNNDLRRIGSKVYANWLGRSNGSTEHDVLVSVSLDGGAAFQPTVSVSSTPDRATQGVLDASGDNVYVSWEQVVTTSSGGSATDVFFSRSTNNGRTFTAVENLSEGISSQDSVVPAISASGKYVHVLWMDGASSDFDIFYRRSNDNGISFGSWKLLPDGIHNPLAEGSVDVVSRGIDIYAVWTRRDVSTFNNDVYYYSKRSCPFLPAESGFKCLVCCR